MPSFDVVSEVDSHELTNAVDQANREVSQRFDFRDTGASYELADFSITLHAQVDFQLKQMLDILDPAAAWHRCRQRPQAPAPDQGLEIEGPGRNPG